jgi:ribonuclease HI
MIGQITCKTCNGKLVKRETQRKASQLRGAYYYTAYLYCPRCEKIYHDEQFKIQNKKDTGLFDEDTGKNRLLNGGQKDFDVEIWTDGACVFNGHVNARAAWAFVSGDTEKAGLVTGPKQTNNVAEGLAILRAIEWAVGKSYKKIKIYSDSQISINNMRKPAYLIKQNQEIFARIETVIKEHGLSVVFEKVLGHSGDVNNTRADRLANQLAANS